MYCKHVKDTKAASAFAEASDPITSFVPKKLLPSVLLMGF